MAEVKLVVLYPHPKDPERFALDYQEHLALLRQKMGIPEGARPYSVTRFIDDPSSPAPFHQMFSMPFPSIEALQAALGSTEMQEVGADAMRISTGGPIVILVGGETS